MIVRVLNTFAAWSQAFSIRFKVMGLALGMVVLMGTGAGVLAQSAFLNHAQEELDQRGTSLARDLAALGVDQVLTHNSLALHDMVADAVNNNPDVRYVAFFEGQGQVAAHSFPDQFPTDLWQLPWPHPGEHVQVQVIRTEDGLVHDVAVPMLDGTAGLVRVGMSEGGLRLAAMSMTQNLVLAILLIAAVGVAAAYLLTQLLTRPILSLVETSQAVGSGDLSRRAAPGPPDEIGRLIDAFNGMVSHLQGAQKARDELLAQVINAQEEERRRVARELHDQTSQAISSLLVGLRNLEDAANHPGLLQTRTAEMRRLAAATLSDIHHLVMELRPRSLDDLGLVAALRHYAADFGEKYGLPVDLQALGPATRLPAPIEVCLYRIVQEALTNVARHARATAASVVLDLRPGQAAAVVEDDGVGFDPEAVLQPGRERAALGLLGMQERAPLGGGTHRGGYPPGGGTAVYVRISVPPEEPEHDQRKDTPAAGG